MTHESIKQEIVAIARTAYLKGLTSGWGGNISMRTQEGTVLITPHKKSLGLLKADDILLLDNEGKQLAGDGKPSTETDLHLAIYRSSECNAVMHLHTPALTSLAVNDIALDLDTFESRLMLGGTPPVIPQSTPTVTDIQPVIDALSTSNIVMLRNHGLVTVGDNLEDAYTLADTAEEAARMTINNIVLKGVGKDGITAIEGTVSMRRPLPVFSREHMQRIQELVNNDEEALRLGAESGLSVKYAIKQIEDGQVFNIHFENGRIEDITEDEDADFLNAGKRETWIHVFNGRLDPFAATSQKKLRLIKGRIGDLSKWYAPFYRIFDLWKQAPVQECDDE